MVNKLGSYFDSPKYIQYYSNSINSQYSPMDSRASWPIFRYVFSKIIASHLLSTNRFKKVHLTWNSLLLLIIIKVNS